ncbi:hypothetical protein A2V55_02425 [Candidatus Woesebacteria bacterium RBG_19FT_COMBO_37_29]|uniref:Phosphoglucosamine mutase n=2 Tax=Candidatus Woeseibacteriota TaxID=1752722 RepID=A0A1F7XN74_9BACT|nr:MAG: hypothetical protein A2V55_02425 [Candidatus Woesebacteria bacterium RBG_19FT_COMBO_37_29]
MKLFGTSGIRGSADDLFTNQFCFDIGRTYSLFLKSHNEMGAIAIGMDPRGSSPRIKEAIISGLVFAGREVFDEGATPIPAVNYILKVDNMFSGSLMVSGSHIKADLNGIKFFAFKEEILKVNEKEIEQIYAANKDKIKYTSLNKNITNENRANESYQEYLFSLAQKPLPAWKVVVDAGNGAQSDTMPQVLKRLGLEVIEMNCSIQGEFYARDTEIESDYSNLIAKVKDVKADFGVGYDADGDRVVFIDEKGSFITGDYTGTLIAREVEGDTIVTPINASQVIDKIGKKVERTKVGSPYVVEKMKEKKASFGFEANGGGIFAEMLSRDGGHSTIEILNILAKSNKRLSEVVAELPKYYIYRDKVAYKWELKDKIINEAKENFKGEKIDETDGLKIWLNDNTWILFRSSLNAPEFRVFVESKSKEKAQNLIKEGLDFVKRKVNG